jgi:hypothetical protein
MASGSSNRQTIPAGAKKAAFYGLARDRGARV